jgi:hypothetical protein
MTPGASHITGTILQAYVNADGVTHAELRTAKGEKLWAPLQVRGEAPHALKDCSVRSIDGLWVLTKAAQP